MIVKNFYVSDKDYFIEYLIRYLIKYGISYCFLKEENEIHFDNYIIRFHVKVNEIDNISALLNTLIDTISMDKNEILKVSENKEFVDKNVYQRRNKMLIKQENRCYSKLINTRRK